MRVACFTLAVAVLLSGCHSRADVASIGSQDRPSPVSYQVTGTVTVGKRPVGVAVDPSTGTVYVANWGDGTVSVIDAATRTVVADIPIGHGSANVAVDPGTHTIFVLNPVDPYVTVIDGVARAVIDRVPVGKQPTGLAVDPITHLVYVSDRDTTLSVLDGRTRAVIDTVPVIANQTGVVVDPETNTVYVGSTRSPEGELPYSSEHVVSVVDGSTRAVTGTVVAGLGRSGLAFDSSARILYVANQWDKTVASIDASTNTVAATVAVDGGLHPPGAIAVDPGTHTVYVIPYRNNSVVVIDGLTNNVVATVPVGENLSDLAVDSATHAVYVTQNDGTVSIIENVP